MADTDIYLTEEEFADRYHLGRRTVQRWQQTETDRPGFRLGAAPRCLSSRPIAKHGPRRYLPPSLTANLRVRWRLLAELKRGLHERASRLSAHWGSAKRATTPTPVTSNDLSPEFSDDALALEFTAPPGYRATSPNGEPGSTGTEPVGNSRTR